MYCKMNLKKMYHHDFYKGLITEAHVHKVLADFGPSEK